jgi:hypothetical protein
MATWRSSIELMNRLNEADVLAANVLRLRKEILGERHLVTITASSNLANVYRGSSRLGEAEVLAADVLRLRKGYWGGVIPRL